MLLRWRKRPELIGCLGNCDRMLQNLLTRLRQRKYVNLLSFFEAFECGSVVFR